MSFYLSQFKPLSIIRSYIYEVHPPPPPPSSGNLLQLNAAMEHHEAFFIRCGIYLILEKLKIITYRNLFKKVWVLLNAFSDMKFSLEF